MKINKYALINNYNKVSEDFNSIIDCASNKGMSCIDRIFDVDTAVLDSLFNMGDYCVSDVLYLLRDLFSAAMGDSALYLQCRTGVDYLSFYISDVSGGNFRCLCDSDITYILDTANRPFSHPNKNQCDVAYDNQAEWQRIKNESQNLLYKKMESLRIHKQD